MTFARHCNSERAQHTLPRRRRASRPPVAIAPQPAKRRRRQTRTANALLSLAGASIGAKTIQSKSSTGRTPPLATLEAQSLHGKRVLVREDFNVPLEAGRIASTVRIQAALPTIRHCLDAGAGVLLMSHLGRPRAGFPEPALSLAPVAAKLGEYLRRQVALVRNWHDGMDLVPGEVALLENIRFEPGEESNDPRLARRLAALCDVFVLDAFATAHRAHASTCGVVAEAPVSCAGPLLTTELQALSQALDNPPRPLVAVVGGAKVSTKLGVLDSLAEVADCILVGGGIANTFLAAAGNDVGASLAEHDRLADARRIAAKVEAPIAQDVMTCRADGAAAAQPARLRPASEVGEDEAILDLGPATLRTWQPTLARAGTILWNGPLGVFEHDQFGEGTRNLAEAVASSSAYSIAGGGDTLAAIEKYGVAEGISYLSTGGGAFLEFVEGRTLPGIAALQERAHG